MPTSSSSSHHHRSSSLRQSNKKNKRSKSSKRSLTKAAGGKVTSLKAAHQQQTIQQTKADRKHHQTQLREAKKQERLRQLRGWVTTSNNSNATGSVPSLSSSSLTQQQQQRPPRVVGIVSLGPPSTSQQVEEDLRSYLLQGADATTIPSTPTTTLEHQETPTKTSSSNIVTARYAVHKKDGNLTILTNSTAFAPHYHHSSNHNTPPLSNDNVTVLGALDLCRVCDMILFVIPDSPGITTDEEKEDIMAMNIGGGGNNSTTGRSHSSSTTTTIGQEWDYLISTQGDKILAAVKAQGLPTPLTVLAHSGAGDDTQNDENMTFQSTKSLRRSAVKRRQVLKRFATRFALTEFGTDGSKVMEVDLNTNTTLSNDNNENDDDEDDDDQMEDDEAEAEENKGESKSGTGGSTVFGSGAVSTTTSKAARQSAMTAAAFIRTICTMAASPPKWVSELPRPYMVADTVQYDATLQELQLTGHVRGRVPLNVNSLFHIPNMGTFHCKSITKAATITGLLRKAVNKKAVMDGGNNSNNDDIVAANPELQESLNMFATPNALEGEQNLIGFDEDDDEEEGDDEDDGAKDHKDKETVGFARPAGWSDYQSAWLDAVDDKDGATEAGDFDHGELAKQFNQPDHKKGIDANNSVADQNIMMDLDEANHVSKEERAVLSDQRRKDQTDHLHFPDEVQVGEDENARDRFARYRALKSFKKTYWDPKENLPESYASIYHFASFKATQSSVMKDMKDKVKAANACDGIFWGKGIGNGGKSEEMDVDDNEGEHYDPLEGCVPAGAYVTITLKVPLESFASIDPKGVIAAVALLQHEHKVSVLHMGLNRPTGLLEANEIPIKSKDVLTFRCGWRTWQGRPVFSQNNINCDKHKFERYLPQEGSFFAASVFGPVTYTPCPILVFREKESALQLVAIGSMIGADASRIVVKRIVMTGFPVKVQKRFATVKYMFYNPEDVRWFKPADLTTKHGLHGNIMESVGEHGTMKCLFNAPIKQHDTVCLQLYKRIYPKFVEAPEGEGSDRVSVRTLRKHPKLLVK